MYLIDWFQANFLMAATVVVLIGIPLVILLIVMTRKSKERKDDTP